MGNEEEERMHVLDLAAGVSPEGLTTLGLTCGSNMPTGGCEVQAEQPSDLSAYPVRFKPLLGRPPLCPPQLRYLIGVIACLSECATA